MKLTASKLQVIQQCAYPARDDVSFPPLRAGEDAQFGNAFHDSAYGVIAKKPKPLAELATKYNCAAPELELYLKAMVDFWGPRINGKWRGEQAYAFVPKFRDVVHLGEDLKRDYSSAPQGSITGTNDYEGFDAEDVLVVGDWKTGFPDNVESAKTNKQLRFNAFCAARHHGRDRVRIEIAFVRPGRVWVDSCDLDYMELVDIEEELTGLAPRISSDPAPVPGPRCTYCDGLGLCPGTKDALARVDTNLAHVQWSREITSPEQAAAMAANFPQIKRIVGQIDDALKAYADAHGGEIDIGNGKVYKKVSARKTQLNTKAVKEYLGDKLLQFEHVLEYDQYRVVNKK